MVYTTDGITLTPVRFVIINIEGRTRRIMNPTREQCLQAGVDAYEYSPIPCPETPEGEEGYYSHAYIINSELILDQWTWVPTEPEEETL